MRISFSSAPSKQSYRTGSFVDLALSRASWLCCLGALLCLSLSAQVASASDYLISESAPEEFAGKDAQIYIRELLEEQPELKRRMLDPKHTAEGEDWGYHSQTYLNEAVMEHLLAIQVKTMAELGEIKKAEDLLDPKHGIGSKDHKDKGTIGDALSMWGHPIQPAVFDRNSKLRASNVYHAFRKTIKNELIRYARRQPLEWHLKSPEDKFNDTVNFLQAEYPEKTRLLQNKLQEWDLTFELIIYKCIRSNLLS